MATFSNYKVTDNPTTGYARTKSRIMFPTGGGSVSKVTDAGRYKNLTPADATMLKILKNKGMEYDEELPIDTKAGFIPGQKSGYFSDTAGQGAEWTPTELGSEILDLVRLQSKVKNFHRVIATPSDPYELPVNLGEIEFDVNPGQGTLNTSQLKTPETGVTQFKHHKLYAALEITGEFAEDAVMGALATMRQHLAADLARDEEKKLFFSKSLSDSLYNKAHSVGAAGTTFTEKDLLGLIDALPDEMRLDTPENIVIYLHPALYKHAVGNFSNLQTVDKYGPQATVLTGELGSFYGCKLSVGLGMPDDGEGGLYAVVAHRSSVIVGERRRVRFKSIAVQGDTDILEVTARTAVAYPYGAKTGAAIGLVKQAFQAK